MQAVAVALTLVQVAGQINQGRQEQKLYEAQAATTRAKASAESIRFQQQGNTILRRSLETQAAARARAAAGGLDPFSGSAQFIQDLSEAAGIRDFGVAADNAKLAELGGEQQAYQYEQAGRGARRRGILSAIGTAATGAVAFGKLGGASSAPTGGNLDVQLAGGPMPGREFL